MSAKYLEHPLEQAFREDRAQRITDAVEAIKARKVRIQPLRPEQDHGDRPDPRTDPLPNVIGLCGWKGAGKDTVGQILQGGAVRVQPSNGPVETRVLPREQVQTLAFGDALRDVCRILYGFTDEDFKDRAKKDTPRTRHPQFSPRGALRQVGQHMRKLDPDVWVRVVRERVEQAPPGTKIVITDVRQPNELFAIKEMGGEVWGVYRPGCVFDGHETEMLPLRPDLMNRVIWNGGTLDELVTRVQNRALDRPRAVGCVLLFGSRTIAVSRKNDDTQWSDPGGKVEGKDSTGRAAIRREVGEETGLWLPEEAFRLVTVRESYRGTDGSLPIREFWQYVANILPEHAVDSVLRKIHEGGFQSESGTHVQAVDLQFLANPGVNPFAEFYVQTIQLLKARAAMGATGFDHV